MVSQETIQAMARRIVERFRPERIVLFGSYARGEATEDSDVDFLIEMESDPRAGREGNPIHRMLAEEFKVPTDVVIRTREAVGQHRENPYSVVHQALTEGRVLYEKRPR